MDKCDQSGDVPWTLTGDLSGKVRWTRTTRSEEGGLEKSSGALSGPRQVGEGHQDGALREIRDSTTLKKPPQRSKYRVREFLVTRRDGP